MDESSLMRALTVGVGVFIAIATITAVLSYYNTAKDMVQAVGTGADFDREYSNYIENTLLKTQSVSYITGNDVKNLLNYFYKDEKVQINISLITPLYSDTDENLLSSNLSGNNVNNHEKLYNSLSTKIVPTQKFKLERQNVSGRLIINLNGIK